MAKHSRGQTFLRIIRIIGIVLMMISYVLLALWCFGAIAYAPYPKLICIIGNVIFTILILAAPFIKPRLNFICAGFILMLFVVICWQFVRPSHNRMWQPGFESIASVSWTDQDTFTVQNIRDCRYVTAQEFHTFYREDTYKLSAVTSVKFVSVYWKQTFENAVAHNMLAFTFDDGRMLLFSFERRCSHTSEFGAIPSLYKQSEICCVVSEPADMLALRTHFRAQGEGERVYMYEMELTPEQRRVLLRNILMDVGELSREPAFFNTATDNCATRLLKQIDAVADLPDWHYSFMFNGFLDRYLYDRGLLVKKFDSETFDEVRERVFLNDFMKKYWQKYDQKKIDDPAYRETSYTELVLKYYGR